MGSRESLVLRISCGFDMGREHGRGGESGDARFAHEKQYNRRDGSPPKSPQTAVLFCILAILH